MTQLISKVNAQQTATKTRWVYHYATIRNAAHDWRVWSIGASSDRRECVAMFNTAAAARAYCAKLNRV